MFSIMVLFQFLCTSSVVTSSVVVVTAPKVIHPADGDTRVDPEAFAALCGEEHREACASDLAKYRVDAGVVGFPRAYAPGREDGYLWYMLYGASSETKMATAEGNLFMWYNGGPGAPPTFGGMTALLPIHADYKVSASFKPAAFKWNEYGSVLFLEGPPRFAGYSNRDGYQAVDPEDMPTSLDDAAEDFLGAMDGIFAQHPELRSKRLYLCGESYAGQYLGFFGSAITRRNAGLERSLPARRSDDTRGTPPGFKSPREES